MVDLEENRDTGRNVEPLRCDRRESHLPAIREQRSGRAGLSLSAITFILTVKLVA
jgi:hypothetical protein